MCDKLKLWDNMQFETRVEKAHWVPGNRFWRLTDASGHTYTSRYLITCTGVLSNPTLPDIPGVEDYKGTSYHTSRWPHEDVSFEGKRVGIIGKTVPLLSSLCVPGDTSEPLEQVLTVCPFDYRHRSHSHTSRTSDSQNG
jgi:hypothetical protein